MTKESEKVKLTERLLVSTALHCYIITHLIRANNLIGRKHTISSTYRKGTQNNN
ncbi:hypothetical protein GF342_01085 [Candidatus Woesearchaeota archaeon]|nr:hypothetical protein [Candidatus Woesearchaeota archaeon]